MISERSLPPDSGRSSGSPAPRSLISVLLMLSCVPCCSLVLGASLSQAALGERDPDLEPRDRRGYPTTGLEVGWYSVRIGVAWILEVWRRRPQRGSQATEQETKRARSGPWRHVGVWQGQHLPREGSLPYRTPRTPT